VSGQPMRAICRARSRMARSLSLLLLLWITAPAIAEWTGAIDVDIWQLPSSGSGTRWLVIHNRSSAEAEGLYHIEVLERAFGAEVWNKHVADHMAITATALRASITKPLKKGGVYPESFDSGFAAWKKKKADGKEFVCTSSVLECLK
jgi:Domain of unknown function (DUF5086)